MAAQDPEVNRIWQLFESFDVFSADATRRQKFVITNLSFDFVGAILVLSASADRPLNNE